MSQHRSAVAILKDKDLIEKIKHNLNDDNVDFDPTHSGWMTYTCQFPPNFKQLEALKSLKLDLSEDKIGRTVIRFKQHKQVHWIQYLLWAAFCFGATISQVMILVCVYHYFSYY